MTRGRYLALQLVVNLIDSESEWRCFRLGPSTHLLVGHDEALGVDDFLLGDDD